MKTWLGLRIYGSLEQGRSAPRSGSRGQGRGSGRRGRSGRGRAAAALLRSPESEATEEADGVDDAPAAEAPAAAAE
eukprot:2841414-Alexandrium_andersonii.AAC.1